MAGNTSTRASKDYKSLEEFFKTKEADVETFVDSLEGLDIKKTAKSGQSTFRKIVEGKLDKVKTPKKLTEHISGFIRIFCGWHGDDYVWHIEPAAIRRPWRASQERIVYIIAKTMHENLPDIEAKIWTPQPDWEIKTVTFKAMGLENEWSFSEEIIEKINAQLFKVLNSFV